MRIAVNTRFLQKNNLEGFGYYIHELLQRITQQNPQHQFLFVFDRSFDSSFIYHNNVSAKVVGPKARHPLAFRVWYDISFSKAAKHFKADIILSLDGFCCLNTTIPQILAVHDLAYLHYPNYIAWYHLWFYKCYQKKFIEKATKVITVSNFSKQDIVQQYHIPNTKINVIYNGIRSCFNPVSYEIKNAVKHDYTNGCEFFLSVGGIHPRKNIIQLLKAFSLFKKWHQSNMKLVIAGRFAWQTKIFKQQIETYKYKADVVLLGYVNDVVLSQIMASAYALVYPSLFEGFGVPIIEAMQCGTPVITSNTSSMPEAAGNAALYTNPNDAIDIANQMKLLYKDEMLRTQLIKKGFLQAQQFSWDESALALTKIIEEVAIYKSTI